VQGRGRGLIRGEKKQHLPGRWVSVSASVSVKAETVVVCQCKSRDSTSVSTQQKSVHIIVAETERR